MRKEIGLIRILSRVFLLSFIVFAFMAVIRCGGGSSGGGGAPPENIQYTGKTTQAVITEENVNEIVGTVGTLIPGCGNSRSSSLPLSLVKSVKSAMNRPPSVRTFSRMVFARLISRNAVDYPVSGTCGGTVTVTGSHDNATTIGDVTFSDFCTDDFSSDDTKINGSISFTDRGSQGFAGPVREELTASTGQLSVESGADAASVAFSNFSYDVGTAGQAPRLLTPDIVSLGTLLWQDENTGEVSKIEDFQVKLYESCYDICPISFPDDVYMQVNSGRVYEPEAGYVNIKTPVGSPLVINTDGELVSGGLELKGAEEQSVALSMDVQETGVLSVSMGDRSVSEIDLNCSDIDLGFNLVGSTEPIGIK